MGQQVFRSQERLEGSRLSHAPEKTFQGGNDAVMISGSSSEWAVESCMCFSRRGVGWKPAWRGCGSNKRASEPEGLLSVWFVLMRRHPIVCSCLRKRLKSGERKATLEKMGRGRKEGQRQQDYFCHQRPSAHICAACRAHILSYLFVLVT